MLCIRCGECDAADPINCNFEYQTDTEEECPILNFDGLTGGPITIPPLENATEVPTMVPQNVTCPPVSAPTTSGGGNGGGNDDSGAFLLRLSPVWVLGLLLFGWM